MRALAKLALLAALVLAPVLPAEAAGRVGIVLLHGKTGMPDQLAGLSGALAAAGFAVETPEMCWSKQRIFDHAFQDCLSDVDAAIAVLKAKGASAIIIGGTSQGAVAALAYASMHRDLAGVIAMAPAADPNDDAAYPKFADAVAHAQVMVQAGKGNTPANFADLISGGHYVTVHATPDAFLSFHDPAAPVATVRNLTASVLPAIAEPVLWVAGSRDGSQKGSQKSFAAIPHQAKSRYATVDADHAGTPDASASVVIDWLNALR